VTKLVSFALPGRSSLQRPANSSVASAPVVLAPDVGELLPAAGEAERELLHARVVADQHQRLDLVVDRSQPLEQAPLRRGVTRRSGDRDG
jgi:hypothetical protein